MNAKALAWVMLLTSGDASATDAAALQHWRMQSPAHRRAFAEAKLLWEVLGPAAADVSRRLDPSAACPQSVTYANAPGRRLGRRAFLGGALAASAAALAYVGSEPPFRAWPSFAELRADYRTARGEQRQVALADGVSLLLNTQTSIGLRQASTRSRAIELIAGEAAFVTKGDASIDILAAAGETRSAAARFDMRRDGDKVRVTCVGGLVEVDCHGLSTTVPPGWQLTYDAVGVAPLAAIDPVVATAWQHGQLIFRHERLARVVDEVNRYREGRIILLNDKLGERDVVATFELDRLDAVAGHLARAFGAHMRSLPGGLVFLS